MLKAVVIDTISRLLGGDADSHEESQAFGFHIEFSDLYRTILYLACIYVLGQFVSRVLKMPCLVGEIFCGILLGPPLADIVPNPGALVLIGEIGLILLVVEAGIDIDLTVMELVGTRGFLIAVVGSILPIAIGWFLAWMIQVGDVKAILAAGAVFGPTSLGIALNVLKGGGVLNTPVGQMIVAAAVIDDMIALVVLSQLEALVGTITISGIIIPIVSAALFLALGGYICVFIMPKFIYKFIISRVSVHNEAKIEMVIMFGLLLALMPATHYARASYLMGSFLAGLTFCSSERLHHLFVRQFKRLLQWLMRIFFACTIGFQVPIMDFADATIIWQGLVFCLAWVIGKISVGFMVPNFSQSKRYTGNHLRDCMVTGFSMAAEGEFAFVIAVFAVSDGLVSEDLYASLILAVLLSTIIPPFFLRFTIAYYNKKGEEAVERAAEEEALREHSMVLDVTSGDDDNAKGVRIKNQVFLVIQTQSESSWGLLTKIMNVMGNRGLDVIDHRAWSPRGINTTLVNEVYVRCSIDISSNESPEQALDKLIEEITESIKFEIDQPDSKVKVQRWFPGVFKTVVQETHENNHKSIRERLLNEATENLERKQKIQVQATTGKSIEEIDCDDNDEGLKKEEVENSFAQSTVPNVSNIPKQSKSKPRRRHRHKTHSTPVVGGGLFGEEVVARSGRDGSQRMDRVSDFSLSQKKQNDLKFSLTTSDVPAKITVDGEVYHIRISETSLIDLKAGVDGKTTDSHGVALSGIEISARDDAPVVQRLQGFVRNSNLGRIQEEDQSEASVDSTLVTT